MTRQPHGEVAIAVEALERVISCAPVAELPALSGELERLRATALLRMITLQMSTSSADTNRSEGTDRYLTMQEVKKRTGLSLSHLYEMGRTGALPVKPMGRGCGGKRPRGYRVLLSDLLAWEANLGNGAVDVRLNSMLSSPRDRRRVETTPTATPAYTGATRGPARRPPDHAFPMGARRERHLGARRETDPAAEAGPEA